MKDGISERELNIIVHNDAEWRKFMIRKIEQIESEQKTMLVTVTSMKIKIGFISGIFGAVSAIATTLIAKKLGG